MNFVGAFLGQKVAQTVSDTIDPGTGTHGLVIVMCGLLGVPDEEVGRFLTYGDELSPVFGFMDTEQIDAASHGGVDDARSLRERAVFAPARDRFDQ